MADNDYTTAVRRRHREEKPRDRFFKLRNILNLIFMIGAVVGVVLYFNSDTTVGTVIMLAAVVLKIIECSLRFIH